MSNGWAGLAAAALLAAAFFLPALLSHWGDQRLLDEPHITRQDEEREGFAESLQLSVAEKLFLLRSGSVTSVALGDVETAEVLWQEKDTAGVSALWQGSADAARELEENEKKWQQRLTRVRSELRGLQTAGALPYLWDSGDEVECTAHRQTLYIDGESQVSFLSYDGGREIRTDLDLPPQLEQGPAAQLGVPGLRQVRLRLAGLLGDGQRQQRVEQRVYPLPAGYAGGGVCPQRQL